MIMTKIKEIDAKDEDELLELLWSEPEYNKDWDKGWKWIDLNRIKIKDIFKYKKVVSLEIESDDQIDKCYLDFGDGSQIRAIDEFLVTKKDDLSINRTHMHHLYSKKKKYVVKYIVETSTCNREDYESTIYVGFRDLVIIKIPLESIMKIYDRLINLSIIKIPLKSIMKIYDRLINLSINKRMKSSKMKTIGEKYILKSSKIPLKNLL